MQKRSLHAPARNPPGHESGHSTGRKQEEEDRSQNCRASPQPVRAQRVEALPGSPTTFTPYFAAGTQVEYPAGATASECGLSRFTRKS